MVVTRWRAVGATLVAACLAVLLSTCPVAGASDRVTAQRLDVAFSAQGASVRADRAWTRLSLAGVGRGSTLRPVEPAEPATIGKRVSYAHPGVREWYENGPLGLEQGFTVSRAPRGDGALILAISLHGNLRPRLERGAVLLGGQLRYAGLAVTDARGRAVRSWLSVGKGRLLIHVADRGAAYPVVVDPFIQKGPKVTGAGEDVQASFGASLALSADGTTAIAGAPNDNARGGAAYVYTRSASGSWTDQKKLVGANAVGDAAQGASVAISADGNTALVGGPDDNRGTGATWVFTRSGGAWTQQGAKLLAVDVTGAALQGASVALSADGATALIGGYGDSSAKGAAWVFTRSGSTWTQQSKLVGSGAIGGFIFQGWSVALSANGSTALIGGPGDGSGPGAAWVFTRAGTTWSEQSKLVGSDSAGAAVGSSVALSSDGTTALLGGPNDNAQDGAAWVFTRSGASWGEQAKLVATDATGSAYLGWSVALSGDGSRAWLGGPGDDRDVGAAWQFGIGGNGHWTQQAPKFVGPGATGTALQGLSVAVSADGNWALIGGPYDNSRGAMWGYVLGKPQAITFTTSPRSPTLVADTYMPAAKGGGSTSPVTFSVDASSGAGVCSIDASRTRVTFNAVGTCVIDADQAGDGDYDPAPQVQQSVTVLPLTLNKIVSTDGTIASQGWDVSVSADGNTVLVGGPGDNDDKGAAWVFVRAGDTWTQQGKLVGTAAVGQATEGYSVALSADGNTAVVGGPNDTRASGAVWVFTRANGVWTQQGGKLTGLGASGNAFLGASVAVSADGSTVVAGGYSDNNLAGATWVFTRTNGIWRQQGAKLVGAGAVGAAYQGWRVALSGDGNTALAGGPQDNGGAGAAWVFTRSGSTWTQQGGKLAGSGAAGAAQQGTGVALSGDGDTAMLGGPNDAGGTGAAWMFLRSGAAWAQQGAKLVGTGATGAAGQGLAVALSANGSMALSGGAGDDTHIGAGWVFARSGVNWSQSGGKLVGHNPIGTSAQGSAVALSGDGTTAILGGGLDNGAAGATWAFTSPLFFPTAAAQLSVSHVETQRDGTVTFMLKTSQRGTIDVLASRCGKRRAAHSGPARPGRGCYAFARRHVVLSRSGTTRVTVRPGARGRREVRHHTRAVRIDLWVTYRPDGATSRSFSARNLLVTR